MPSQRIQGAVHDTIECQAKERLESPAATLTYLLALLHFNKTHVALPKTLPRNIRKVLKHRLLTQSETLLCFIRICSLLHVWEVGK